MSIISYHYHNSILLWCNTFLLYPTIKEIISIIFISVYTSLFSLFSIHLCETNDGTHQISKFSKGFVLGDLRQAEVDFLWVLGKSFVQHKNTKTNASTKVMFEHNMFHQAICETLHFFELNESSISYNSEPFWKPKVIYFSWPAVVLKRRTPWQPEVSEPKRTCALKQRRQRDGRHSHVSRFLGIHTSFFPFTSRGSTWY